MLEIGLPPLPVSEIDELFKEADINDDGRLSFDEFFFSHEIGLVKPDREAYDHVVRALGVPPDRILFLDDNQINIEGARGVGLQAERAVGVEQAGRILARYAPT